MATLLVTGGCGFIGSHLVDRLVAQGRRVRVLDDLSTGDRANLNPAAELIEGSVTDPALVAAAMDGVSGCFHLAAVSSVERSVKAWREASMVNALGAVTVFEACARVAAPVVYASSAAVYGAPLETPLSEDAPTRPLSPYGADKLSDELHARVGGVCLGLKSFGLRFFNIYGPRQDPRSPYSGVISIFAARARRGEDLAIFGDGAQTRDFVYVADVVDALCAALPSASTDAPICNVATGNATTVLDLARALVSLTRSESRIVHLDARIGDIQRSLGNPAAIRAALNWSAQTDLMAGLNLLVQSIENGRGE